MILTQGGYNNVIYTDDMPNKHIDHLEDIIFSGRRKALAAVNDVMNKPHISVKWDGAPAIVFGTNPENDQFFVGTKSVFNKKKVKICYSYSDIDGATSMLAGGIPKSDTGVGGPYSLGSLTVPITSGNVRSEGQLKVRAKNVNGVGNFSNTISKLLNVHTAEQSGISEIAIPVEDSLGDGSFLDDGIRIFNFSLTSDANPALVSINPINFYTDDVFSESSDPGIEGTSEASIRFGEIVHDVNDYSDYLPAGPDRSLDTGTQYFTFAFRRKVVANFDINITSSGISGLWIAAPGTDIDNTSNLNGWLDCSVAYEGAGIPGSAAGGNGGDGCAFNNSDLIAPNVSLSGGYTMTLGEENMSNAAGNVVLVRIALASGQSISSLSITEASV